MGLYATLAEQEGRGKVPIRMLAWAYTPAKRVRN